MNETDWGRRQTGPARQQVVQAAAGPRRRYGVIDEVDDRRRSSVVGTAAAARRQGLRTETESTCTRADRISHNTLVTARLQLTFQITQATLHKRKYTRIWIYSWKLQLKPPIASCKYNDSVIKGQCANNSADATASAVASALLTATG